MKSRWPVVIVVGFVLLGGSTAGVLFGERTIPASEEHLVLRASRIVNNLLEWLPDEHSPADLTYDGIGGMLEVLDPHSSFLDPRSFTKMRARQEGSFFGVGIIISRRDGQVTVIAPMEGTPAAAIGLRAGDVISQVEGQDTEDLPLDEVVDLVRGPEDTPVRLTIVRPGLMEPLKVEITRARIPTNSVRFAFMLDDGVGYIRLTEFSNTSVHEVRTAIADLLEQGMESLVFDLRNNPGGPLDAAVGVSDLFLRQDQLIVSTGGRVPDSVSSYSAPSRSVAFSGPLVVLVNGGSASASEIVAGAVQDHDRGLVIGDVTWGKGLVQTVFSVRDTGLALTTARYYTPSGRSIQRDFDSFIDYITHRNRGNGNGEDSEIYETDGGRTVLGGGGITPDITVEDHEFSAPVAQLFGRSAFFRFSVELLQEIADTDHAGFAETFEPTPEVLERFWAFVAKHELLSEQDVAIVVEDEAALADVKRSIHVEVLNATLGLEDGYRRAIEADDQLVAAVGHFEEATDLRDAWLEHGG
jgi:carboxyl-terminal processing protease